MCNIIYFWHIVHMLFNVDKITKVADYTIFKAE